MREGDPSAGRWLLALGGRRALPRHVDEAPAEA